MQLIENFEPVPPLHNRKNIENFIDQSLLGDWVIRVEYSGKNPQGKIDWVQWGSTMFAIKSSCDVMREIDACHANYPAKEIRIYAEKVRPEMRMVYSVYRPTEFGLNDKVSVSIISEAANQEWPRPGNETVPVKAKANSAWRYLAAAGTLAGTLIVWEVASS
ncbi:ribulose bisphosphate carboxylase small subunit [Kaarinaea lacus]